MKKEIKVVICVVLSIWFFFMGFELGAYREKKKLSVSTTVAVQPATQNNASLTTALTTAVTTESTTESTLPSVADTSVYPDTGVVTSPSNASTTTKKSTDPSSLSKAEIIAAAKKAIDGVKAEQNMTAVQTENIAITVNDCSVPSALNMVNSIVQKFTGEKSATYTFANGQATGVRPDGEAVEDEGVVSPTQVIPPKNKNFELTEAGTLEASAKKDGENTVYTIKIVEESTTLDSPVPANNSAAIGYLDLTKISDKISGAKITEANMHYPGSTVTATVNKTGKLIKLELYLPMDGYGEAKLAFISGNASFSGSQTETWTFTY